MLKSKDDAVLQEPLIPISTKDMNAALELFSSDTAEDAFVQGMIIAGIRSKEKKDNSSRTEVFAPYGDVSRREIVAVFNTSNQEVTFYSPDANDSRFAHSLLTTKLIDWQSKKRKLYLHAIPAKQMPVINLVIEQKGLEIAAVDKTHFFWMKKEQAISLETACPEGTCLKDLDLDMVEYVDEYWPFRFPGSVELTKNLLKNNFGLGLFLEDETKPVAWAICSHICCISMLYTLEAHRRKGYAELVLAGMARRLAEMGVSPGGTVIVGNRKSESLFEKIGFQKGFLSHYLILESKK